MTACGLPKPARSRSIKHQNPLVCVCSDVKIANTSKLVPHWNCSWTERCCCRRLNPRHFASTAPPSCCSTWFAGRPDRTRGHRTGERREHRLGIRLTETMHLLRMKREVEIRSRDSYMIPGGCQLVFH